MRDLLKFQNAFVDGHGYAGLASSTLVPKIEVATREYAAAGVGPIEVRMARLANVMTAEMNFEGFDPTLYGQIDITEGSFIAFTTKGSTEDDDGTTHAHTINMRGFIKMLDEGEWKDGESVPLKLGLSLRYYKRVRDGQLLIEYDPLNMIWRGPDGKNKLEEHKRNIGR